MLRIEDAPLLRELTTLRLGGKAVALARLDSERDLDGLPAALKRLGGTPAVIGRGSNILAEDGDLPLVLVKPDFTQGPEIAAEDAEGVSVRVGAGVPLPRLLGWAKDNGLSGLEGLAGVPGAVGGGVAMNAGSYGVELGTLIVEMRVFTPRLGIKILHPGEFTPLYRELAVPGLRACGWWMACEVVLRLNRGARDTITARMAEYLARKKATQPVSAHSAGCVFRNPEGQSAGKLLDEAGFRGKRLGGMAFSDLHANFLINEGQGSGAAALELMTMAREAVAERFGITLHHEVKLWRSC